MATISRAMWTKMQMRVNKKNRMSERVKCNLMMEETEEDSVFLTDEDDEFRGVLHVPRGWSYCGRPCHGLGRAGSGHQFAKRLFQA